MIKKVIGKGALNDPALKIDDLKEMLHEQTGLRIPTCAGSRKY